MKPKILFDIGHPAHFHLFKNFIFYLKEKKFPFVITTRDKEINNILVAHYGLDYISLTKPGRNMWGMFMELIKRDWSIYRLHCKEKFTHAFGTSVSIAHLSVVSKLDSFNFCEDDDSVIPLQTKLTYPFTTKIINPDCIKYQKWHKKRILLPSYHELAYLHPNNFTPDLNILNKYGLTRGRYIIFRLSALKAHHDIGAKGITPELKEKISTIIQDYDIIESNETKTAGRIQPWDMHHVLAFAKMIICDSQTMAAEAMVLGIPSVRINTFVGKISYLEELENKYNLGFGFLPDKTSSIIEKITYLANNEDVDNLWQIKHQKMLSDKIDLNKWMIDFFENEINK